MSIVLMKSEDPRLVHGQGHGTWGRKSLAKALGTVRKKTVDRSRSNGGSSVFTTSATPTSRSDTSLPGKLHQTMSHGSDTAYEDNSDDNKSRTESSLSETRTLSASEQETVLQVELTHSSSDQLGFDISVTRRSRSTSSASFAGTDRRRGENFGTLVYITEIHEGVSKDVQAKLAVGDRLVSINGEALQDMEIAEEKDVFELLKRKGKDGKLVITVEKYNWDRRKRESSGMSPSMQGRAARKRSSGGTTDSTNKGTGDLDAPLTSANTINADALSTMSSQTTSTMKISSLFDGDTTQSAQCGPAPQLSVTPPGQAVLGTESQQTFVSTCEVETPTSIHTEHNQNFDPAIEARPSDVTLRSASGSLRSEVGKTVSDNAILTTTPADERRPESVAWKKSVSFYHEMWPEIEIGKITLRLSRLANVFVTGADCFPSAKERHRLFAECLADEFDLPFLR